MCSNENWHIFYVVWVCKLLRVEWGDTILCTGSNICMLHNCKALITKYNRKVLNNVIIYNNTHSLKFNYILERYERILKLLFWLKISMFHFLNFFGFSNITLRYITKRRLYKWCICYVLCICACMELNIYIYIYIKLERFKIEKSE